MGREEHLREAAYSVRTSPAIHSQACNRLWPKFLRVSGWYYFTCNPIYPYSMAHDPSNHFKRTISSPSAILVVGKPAKPIIVGLPPTPTFVSQTVIDKLPFFATASQGEDSVPKVTILPGDNAEVIAAFIEYIKTGSYTYYRGNNSPGAAVPPVDLKQALFHVEFYATAIKYSCEEVASKVLGVVQYSLSGLNGVDSLAVWTAGYRHECGLTIEKMERLTGVEKLMAKLKNLGTFHARELADTARDCPPLAGDMLVLFKNV